MATRDDGFVFYRFDACDPDLELDLDCYVQLRYSPSSAPQPSLPNSVRTTIILGEFDPAEVATQAHDWFEGQYGIVIDSTSVCEFLTMIAKYSHTSFIAVVFDINKTEFFSD